MSEVLKVCKRSKCTDPRLTVAIEAHHLIRAAYLLPALLGHIARNVLQFSPQTVQGGTLLYNYNLSLADLSALEDFQSFGDQFNPRARPQFTAWIKAQWHSTGEAAPGYYTLPEHAQLWADLYSGMMGSLGEYSTLIFFIIISLRWRSLHGSGPKAG